MAAKQKEIGTVIHYFDKAQVAVIRLTAPLAVGDTVTFKKGDEEFSEAVSSMQIDHEAITKAKKGQEAAIKVSQPAKQGTLVYKE